MKNKLFDLCLQAEEDSFSAFIEGGDTHAACLRYATLIDAIIAGDFSAEYMAYRNRQKKEVKQ